VGYAPCLLTDDILPIGTPTGISTLHSPLTIHHSPLTINLNGQRVGTDYRGFVISGGKKYLNR
jgi:hypothetical protein